MTTPDISIEGPSPHEPLGELTEALWNRRDDALACRFVVSGALPDPTDAGSILSFLEKLPVREGLLRASQALDDSHQAYILAKPRLYRPEDIRFERTDAAGLSRDLIGLLGTRRGPTAGDGGAGLVEAFLREAGVRPGGSIPPGAGQPAPRIADVLRRPRAKPGVSVFRSTTRWAFWVAGSAQFTALVLDAGRSRVTVVVVGWDEPGVSPWWLEGTTPVPVVEPDRSIPLPLEPLDASSPAIAAFQASLRMSTPNGASFWMRFASPSFQGGPGEVAGRIEQGGLLPRLLADPLVRRRAGAGEIAPSAVRATFHRGEVEELMKRLALLMEEGGTFSGTRIEPPCEVAATIRGIADEITGGDPSRALVYATYERWSPWFVGVLLSTSLVVDTASGAVTILMVCECD